MTKQAESPDNSFYYTIDKPGQAEFKERGSRFIACAYPVSSAENFKKYLQELKKEHQKAVHHCFAYRIGTDGNNFRISDDGEPSGTAGRPILEQIDSKQVTDTAIIVVRYFGGTLLGVPGLINAYKTVSALALQVTPIIQKQKEVNYKIQFDYTCINDVMLILKQYSCNIIKQELQLFPVIETGIPQNRLDEVLYRMKEIPGLEISKIII
jgi:uncharacterized YigZ family protein